MRSVVLVVLVVLAAALEAGKLPSYIKACSKSDPKLNECAVKNGQAAIPFLINGDKGLGIPKLDPLEIEKVMVGDGKRGGGGLGIAFACYKCQISGLRNLTLTDAKLNLKKQMFEVSGKVPRVGVKGRYTAEGKVLILPIKGNGTADLTLSDLNLKFRTAYDLVVSKQDNKQHIKFKNPKLDFNVHNLKIKLTNLFNGDEALGKQMNVFLNENWREVLKEFGPAVIDSIDKIIILIVNSIAEKVPYDEIFLK